MIHRGDYCELCASDCYACMQGIVDHECTSGCHCCDRGDDPVNGLHYTIDTNARTIKCTRRAAPAPPPPVSEGLKCVHCRLPLETCQGQKWETEIINSTRINWRRDEETGTYIAEFPRILDAATSKDLAIELLKKSVKYTSHLFDTGEHDHQLLAHPSPLLNPPLSEEEVGRAKELKASQQWMEQLQHARHAGLAKLKGACACAAGIREEDAVSLVPDHAGAVKYGWNYARGFLEKRQQTVESLLDHLCNSEDKTFCQRGRAELREILGQQFSPREPHTQAGPRCPKCGKSGTLEFHGSEVFAAYVECHDDDCDFDLAANEVGELAQFFPSPEQGWVKEVARLAFGRGGPIADWYCWCEICCLLRRVLPAPPRPSTEEGK